MRILSGETSQYIYFVAVNSTDLKTRETGLSTFTVYYSRNGGAATAMTTPTVYETDSTNMPGVYELLVDEGTTIDSGFDSQEMVFHITATGMAPVTRTIEIYRPKVTAGETIGVSSGAVTNVGTVATNSDKTGYSISGTKTTLDALNDIAATDIVSGGAITTSSGAVSNVTTVATTTTNTDMRGTDSALLAASAPTNWSSMLINSSGEITTSNPASGGGSAHTAQDVADLILANPSNLLVTNSSGQVEASNIVSASNVADAVWDEALSGHTVSGSTGKTLNQLKDGVISIDGSVNDTSASSTTFVTNLTASTSGFYHDKVIVFVSGTLNGQARHIETYNGTTKSITVSQAFTSAPSNGDEFLILATHEHSLSEIADAVLDEVLSGHTTAGTLGKAVADIEADTNELQSDNVPGLIAALNDISTAQVNAEVDTALADYDAPTKAEMDSAFAALNDLSAAQVNAEVDTALADYDAPTKAELDAGLAALNDLSTTDILGMTYESTEDLQDYLRLTRAVLLGKTSGAGTGTENFRDKGDNKNRVTSTINSSGDRTSISTDAT